MSSRYKVAIIGCGGIARAHVQGYLGTDRCDLIACADIHPESAQKFADQHEIPSVYADYKEMMEQHHPDIVSICTHHHLHHEITVGVAVYKPKAIYCEKPMALDLQQADEMLSVCERNHVELIIGHQRRYGAQYAKAKEILDQGAIGRLFQMECYGHPWTSLLVDGTHSIDLLRFYNEDHPIQWVIGQVDTKAGSYRFGHPNEASSMSMFGFVNGVRAILTTGGFSASRTAYPAKDAEALGTLVPPNGYHKLILHGTKGKMEIDGDDQVNGQPIVRVHRGEEVEAFPVELNGRQTFKLVIEDLLNRVERGKEHLMTGTSARATLEVIVGIFQSSKERTLVYFPLHIDNNPLFDLITDQKPK